MGNTEYDSGFCKGHGMQIVGYASHVDLYNPLYHLLLFMIIKHLLSSFPNVMQFVAALFLKKYLREGMAGEEKRD